MFSKRNGSQDFYGLGGPPRVLSAGHRSCTIVVGYRAFGGLTVWLDLACYAKGTDAPNIDWRPSPHPTDISTGPGGGTLACGVHEVPVPVELEPRL